ncbi:hypothetical protein Tco_1485569 [Tanacetum coccineum]
MYSIPTTTLSHAPFFPSLSPAAAATPQNHHLHPAATIVQPHQRGAVSFLEHPKKGALVLQFTHEAGGRYELGGFISLKRVRFGSGSAAPKQPPRGALDALGLFKQDKGGLDALDYLMMHW